MPMSRKDFVRMALVARVMRSHVANDVFEELVAQLGLACDECGEHFDFARFEDECAKPYVKDNSLRVV